MFEIEHAEQPGNGSGTGICQLSSPMLEALCAQA
jgi:hypothetical protein